MYNKYFTREGTIEFIPLLLTARFIFPLVVGDCNNEPKTERMEHICS